MSKQPRRPKGQSGPAQSAAAYSASSKAFQDPTKVDALAAFLGGNFVADSTPAGDDAAALREAQSKLSKEEQARLEAENSIPMFLRNLTKASKTTKTKALTELLTVIPKCSDAGLAPYIVNFAETIKQHVFHDDIQVRLLLFRVLTSITENMGTEVKRALTLEMPTLFGPWVAGTGDMDSTVREAAKKALHTTFKDPVKFCKAVSKFKDDLRRYMDFQLEEVFKGGSSLTDDVIDPRSNICCCALNGLGFVVSKLVSQAATSASSSSSPTAPVAASVVSDIDFILDEICTPLLASSDKTSPLVRIAPGKFTAKTPRVRCAYLSLVTQIVTALDPNVVTASHCSAGVAGGLDESTHHATIAKIILLSIGDANIQVVSTVWPLLLMWLSKHGTSAVAAVPKGDASKFADQIVTVLEKCPSDDTQRLKTILKSIFPFAALMSKHLNTAESSLELLDDIIGTVIEKTKAIHEDVRSAPAGSKKLVVDVLLESWKCLAEVWEIHALRKIDSDAADDTLEALGCLVEIFLEHNLKVPTEDEEDEDVAPTRLETINAADCDTIATNLMAHVGNVVEKRAAVASKIWETLLTKYDEDHPIVAEERLSITRRLAAAASSNAAAGGFIAKIASDLVEQRRWKELAVLLGSSSNSVASALSAEAQDAVVDALSSSTDVNNDSVEAEERNQVLECAPAMLRLALSSEDNAAGCQRLAQVLEQLLKILNLPKDEHQHPLALGAKKALINALSSCKTQVNTIVEGSSDRKDVSVLAWDILAVLATQNDPATFSALLGLGIAPSTPSVAIACFKTVLTASISVMPPPFVHNDGTSDEDSSDDSSDDEDTDSSDDGMLLNSDDDDIETATTFTSTSGMNQGGLFAEKLQQWVECLSTFAGNDSDEELRKVALEVLDVCVKQAFALSPNVQPDQYANPKFLGLVVRTDGHHQHTSYTISYLKAKQHYVGAERYVSLVDHLAEGYAKLGKSFQQDVLPEVESHLTNAKASVVANTAALSFFMEANTAPSFNTLLSPQVWEDLCLDIEAQEKIGAKKMQGRQLERKLAEFSGEHQFSDMNFTVEAGASAIRLGLLISLVSELQHVEDTSIDFKKAENEKQVVAFAKVLLRVASLRAALSTRAAEALSYVLDILFGKMLTKEQLTTIAVESHPFHVVTMASAAVSASNAARFGTQSKDCAANVQDVLSAVMLSNAASWQKDIGRITALLTSLDLVEARMGSGQNSADEDNDGAPTIHLSTADEQKAIEIVSSGLRKAGGSLEFLRVLISILRRQPRTRVFQDACTMAVIECCLAEKNDPNAALALLAEISKARIMNVNLYTEVCSALKHVASQCCSLHHLPSNGRLGQRIANARPLPVFALRELPIAMVKCYEGLQLHNRHDDVLLSSINLVVFDTVCEAIMRLRTTKDDEIPPLIALIADLTPFISQLRSDETRTLAASEKSMEVIAHVLSYTHMWLATCSVAKIESLGIANITQVINCVNELASVTLINNTVHQEQDLAFPDAVVTITKRCPVRAIRAADALTEPMKLNTLIALGGAIDRSSKQKLCLFTYLMAWAGYAEQADKTMGEMSPADLKQRLFPLLDIIAALALSPIHPENASSPTSGPANSTAKRLENSHFSTFAADTLGFEIRTLGRIASATNEHLGSSLARGALSVLTFLLRSPVTVGAVRDWIETLDRPFQAQIESYIVTHISPALIQTSLAEVLAESPDGNPTFELDEYVTVTVGMEKNCVEVVFVQEEASVGIKLQLPEAYPLRNPEISKESLTIKVKGIGMEKWRSWMLKMTMMLLSGSSTLWQCVRLFAENVTKHYEGVEPCPICYSVIAQRTYKLPEMQCPVCKNKFHSTCLYQWWGSSGNSSCPMCRSPWYSQK